MRLRIIYYTNPSNYSVYFIPRFIRGKNLYYIICYDQILEINFAKADTRSQRYLNSLIRYSELLYHQQGNIELYYLYTYYRTLFYHTQFLILTALQTLRASGLSQAITKFAFPTFTPLCRRSSLPLASSITIALSLPTSVGVLQIASASFFFRVAFSRGMQMELSAPNGVINARCHRDVLPDDFFCHGVRGRSGGSIVIGRIDIISFQNRAPRTSAPPVPLRFLGLCQFSGPLLFFSPSHSSRSFRVASSTSGSSGSIGYTRCIYRARVRNFTTERLDFGFTPHLVARYQVYFPNARASKYFHSPSIPRFFGYPELSKGQRKSQSICSENVVRIFQLIPFVDNS